MGCVNAPKVFRVTILRTLLFHFGEQCHNVRAPLIPTSSIHHQVTYLRSRSKCHSTVCHPQLGRRRTVRKVASKFHSIIEARVNAKKNILRVVTSFLNYLRPLPSFILDIKGHSNNTRNFLG